MKPINVNRKCRSTFHVQSSQSIDGDCAVIDLSKVDPLARDRIREKNLYKTPPNKKRTIYVCKKCVLYIKNDETFGSMEHNSKSLVSRKLKKSKNKKSRGRPPKASSSVALLSPADDVVAQILARKFKGAELCKIANAIGITIAEEIREYASNTCNREEDLLSYSYDSYYLQFHEVLRKFLEGIVDFRFDHAVKQTRTKRYLSKAMACILRASNNNYISTPGLAENVVLYCLSGSRACVDMMGHSQGSGCYSLVKNTMTNLGKTSPSIPDSDVIIAYDNNQVLAKNYRIELESKQRTSCVTSLCVFQFSSTMQYSVCLQCPLYWDKTDNNKLFNDYLIMKQALNDTHAEYRMKFIEERLSILTEEIKNGRDTEGLVGIGNSEFRANFSSNYERVESQESTCKIIDQECVPVNPNSKANVKKVLDEILDKSFKNNGRKWVVVVSDGLPYGYATDVIKYTYQCVHCHIEINEKDLDSHHKDNHRHLEFVKKRKYDKIILRPGMGHYEINFVRGLMAVYFDIYIKPVVQKCGFKSPKQLEFIKKSHNHHLSWQVLQIVFESMTDELLRLHVKDQISKDEPVSVHSYVKWAANNKNPNFKAAESFTFTWLHSLFLFRSAIRQCNSFVALAAKEKMSSLFYGFNHPRYREYTCSDVFWMLSIPEEARSLIWLQSSRRENSLFGQGIDFLLEERNYVQKQVLFYEGIPTLEQWKAASCAMGKVEQIKKVSMEGLAIKDRETERRSINLEKEVLAAKFIFRDSKIFEGNATAFTTLCKTQELEYEFLNCVFICEENKNNYYKCHLLHKRPCMKNVIRFASDRIKVMATNTTHDIRAFITEKLGLLSDSQADFYLTSMKGASKEELCSILEAVEAEVEENNVKEMNILLSNDE